MIFVTLLPQDVIAFTDWHRAHQGAEGSLDVVRLGLTREQALAHDPWTRIEQGGAGRPPGPRTRRPRP